MESLIVPCMSSPTDALVERTCLHCSVATPSRVPPRSSGAWDPRGRALASSPHLYVIIVGHTVVAQPKNEWPVCLMSCAYDASQYKVGFSRNNVLLSAHAVCIVPYGSGTWYGAHAMHLA